MRALAWSLPLIVLLAAMPAPANAVASTVSIHRDFGAGAWIVVYAYVPAGTNSVSFTGSFDATTTAPVGDLVGLFAMPPTILVERNGVQDLVGVFDTPLVQVSTLGGPLVRSEDPGAQVATTGIVAVQMGFAASHPWRLDLEMTIPQATFAVVYEYTGATFASADAVATPAVGVQDFEFQVPSRGWTHLSAESTHLQPVGLRTYDVRFPNGFRFLGSGQMTGANALAIGFANSNNYWGGFGATNNAPGTLHARLQYYEASLGAPLAIVHLPWPPNHGLYAINYKTFDGGLDFVAPSIQL